VGYEGERIAKARATVPQKGVFFRSPVHRIASVGAPLPLIVDGESRQPFDEQRSR
jgi:hypothetical protein